MPKRNDPELMTRIEATEGAGSPSPAAGAASRTVDRCTQTDEQSFHWRVFRRTFFEALVKRASAACIGDPCALELGGASAICCDMLERVASGAGGLTATDTR